MTFGQFLAKQFIAVIEWNEPADGILAYRFPMRDLEIENGGKLTVSESQTKAQLPMSSAPACTRSTPATFPCSPI
jgi:membrane protease subunit (stomatin/prohibitin family)